MENPVNIAIIKNPLNWVIIFLMLAFAMLIAEVLFQYMGNDICGCSHTGE